MESKKLRTTEKNTNRQTKSDRDTQDNQTHGHGTGRDGRDGRDSTAHDSAREQSRPGDGGTDRHTRRHTAQNSTTHHSTPQRNPPLPPSSFYLRPPPRSSFIAPQQRKETMRFIILKSLSQLQNLAIIHRPASVFLSYWVSITVAVPRLSIRSEASLSSFSLTVQNMA